MGCFSYLCSECGHSIKSDCFSGEHCILMVVGDDDKVVEWMQGEYDSYGRVFSMDASALKKTEDHSQHTECYEWTTEDRYGSIAAYHSGCFDGDMENVEISEGDSEQGCGEYQFPTEGTHGHGTTIKVKPKWAQPTRI